MTSPTSSTDGYPEPCRDCGATETCDHRTFLSREAYESLLEILERPAEVIPEIAELARRHRERYW